MINKSVDIDTQILEAGHHNEAVVELSIHGLRGSQTTLSQRKMAKCDYTRFLKY